MYENCGLEYSDFRSAVQFEDCFAYDMVLQFATMVKLDCNQVHTIIG